MATRASLVQLAARKSASTKYFVRHKCFLSYHRDDVDEVEQFVEQFGETFIPRVVGVTEDDPLVDSDDTDYIMDKIRENYLTDSTVTIVLIGSCTWARRFVDWEIMSTLRNDYKNKRSGLLALQLPSVDGGTPSLPGRLSDNLSTNQDEAYARYYRYPAGESTLRGWISDAFSARDDRGSLVNNSRARRARNSACP